MITITDKAREQVLAYLQQSEGELEALRVRMQGSPMAPRFELSLVSAADVEASETAVDADGVVVVIDREQADRLEGATIDFVERVNESGFEVRTAAARSGADQGSKPQGQLAERVRALLDERVNPAIASHGGAITLVDVQGTEVYLEMSGGCQGCAMSRLTLRQGVERMLRDEIPEITAIHDATDHASGENPYFT